MLSLQKVLESNFRLWSRCGDVQLERNKQNFQALLAKVQEKGLDPSKVDVTFFMTSTGSNIATASKLDDLLADYASKGEESTESRAEKDARIAEIVERIRTTRSTQLIAATKERIATCERSAQQHWAHALDCSRQLVREMIQLTDLTASKLPFAEGLKSFLSQPDVSVDGDLIRAITPEITLMHEVGEGKEEPVNLGRFNIHMPLSGRGLRVTPLSESKSICVNGYYHPHVSSYHNPCLGNAAEEIAEGFKTYDFQKVYSNVLAILSVYNARSPYVGLEHFYNEQRTRGEGGEESIYESILSENFDMDNNDFVRDTIRLMFREIRGESRESISHALVRLKEDGYFDEDMDIEALNTTPSSQLEIAVLTIVTTRRGFLWSALLNSFNESINWSTYFYNGSDFVTNVLFNSFTASRFRDAIFKQELARAVGFGNEPTDALRYCRGILRFAEGRASSNFVHSITILCSVLNRMVENGQSWEAI